VKVRSRLFAIIFSLILACLITASIASLNAFSTALMLEITKHLEDNAVNWMYDISKDQQDKAEGLRFLSTQFSNLLNSNMTFDQKESFVLDFQRYVNSNITVFIYKSTMTEIFGARTPALSAITFEKKFFEGITKSNVHLTVPGTITKNGKLLFMLTHPIIDKTGTPIGDIILTYSAQSISENSPLALQSDLDFHLLTDDGTIIYSNIALNGPYKNITFANHPLFQKIIQSERGVESGIYPNLDDSSGNNIFVAVKQPFLSGAPNTDWILFTSIAPDRAFSGVLDLRITFIVITVLILAISIFVVFIVSRSISRPIMALRDAAAKIRGGDLTTKIEVKSTDEIGELSNQLDDMRQSIRTRTEEILKKDKELYEVNESLIATEKSKDEFISMISHELKTPITPIKLYSDMLLKSGFMGTLNKKQKKAIETIGKSVLRLQILISDMFDVHKLEIGKLNLSKTPTDVRDMINESLSALLPIAQAKNVKLVSEVKTDGNINCDPSRIEQVISNLVKNAIDFVSSDTGKIVVRVEDGSQDQNDRPNDRSINRGGNLIFTVEDNGIGVPPEKSKHLFKKFYQIDTSASRKHGGTGLGLAICKGIIEEHGGTIWLDLEYDKGARFKFTLPRNNR
jgi:signal transduction histidine kinase